MNAEQIMQIIIGHRGRHITLASRRDANGLHTTEAYHHAAVIVLDALLHDISNLSEKNKRPTYGGKP